MEYDHDTIMKFRSHIRDEITLMLTDQGYQKTYDNESVYSRSDKESWVFKLVFEGAKVIEISNRDWRDYTEYFHVYLEGKEVYILNLLDFIDPESALEELKKNVKKQV